MPQQIVAKHALGLIDLSTEQQRGAVRFPNRIEEHRRLVVRNLVGQGDRFLPRADRFIMRIASPGNAGVEHSGREHDDASRSGKAGSAEERVLRNLPERLGQRRALLCCFINLVGTRQRDTPSEVPPCNFHGVINRRWRQRENFLVTAEA